MTSPSPSEAADGRTPKIAIVLPHNLKEDRAAYRGILEEARRLGPWRCLLTEGHLDEQTLGLDRLGIDGAIVHEMARRAAATLAARHIPVVLFEPYPDMRRAGHPFATAPSVRLDSRAVGVMAADYYLKRGYKSFAYVGEPEELHWSDERREGFMAAIEAANFPCAVYGGPYSERERRRWSAERPRLVRFLKDLPRPTAVLAAMDARAVLVLDACAEAGLRVPEDIAILGVDDDPILCEAAPVALSSIRTGRFRMGQKAAEMLDAMLHGRTPKLREAAIPPLGVVTRESTGYDAMRDPTIARALVFIRTHSDAERIGVGDVVRAAGCSRRYLELRFRAHIGASVKDILLRTKLERVQLLLERTDMPMGEIASVCGFLRDSYLAVVFKRETGLSMTEWRRRHRDAPDE